jgi:ribonuclease HI
MKRQETLEEPMVHLWTDGSSEGKTGPGGYAAVLCFGKARREICGGFPADHTNNSMELYAILTGLEALTRPSNVLIHTDSKDSINWIEGSFKCRVRRNMEIVLKIRKAIINAGHAIAFEKVVAHSGDELNERADQLSKDGRAQSTLLRTPWRRDLLYIDGVQVESSRPNGEPQ